MPRMTQVTISRSAEDLVTLLRSGETGAPLDATLTELITVHARLNDLSSSPTKLLVMALHERLLAQFPDQSGRIIMVNLGRGETAFEALQHVQGLEWWGPRGRRKSFPAFLWDELRERPLLLSLSFVGIFGLLASVHDAELMLAINHLAAGSVTIFISIFLIFSVGESSRFGLDLFKSGRVHEFLQTDKHVAQAAVLALLLSFLGIVNIKMPRSVELLGLTLPSELALGPLVLSAGSFSIPLITTLSLVLIIDVFIAAVQYYFKRHELLLETEAALMLFRPTHHRPEQAVRKSRHDE